MVPEEVRLGDLFKTKLPNQQAELAVMSIDDLQILVNHLEKESTVIKDSSVSGLSVEEVKQQMRIVAAIDTFTVTTRSFFNFQYGFGVK